MTAVTDPLLGSCYAVCAVDRIVVFVWTQVPTLDGVFAMTKVFERVHGSESGQLGLLIMIDPQAGRVVPAAVRDHLMQRMRQYAPKIRAVAFVFEGTGFAATIVRSVITAMNMITRPTYWVSVFADRSRAVTELLFQMNEGTSATSEDVLSALDGLRRHAAPVARD